MKRNYWPLFFIGIFSFVFSMIVWTIVKATSLPVNPDKSFLKSYSEVDENYNVMMQSNILFSENYEFDFYINEKKIKLTTDDIRYSQRVLEKISKHKGLLKKGKNSLKIVVFDKKTKEKLPVNISLKITKSLLNNNDIILSNKDFNNSNNEYANKFEIKEENNWNITGVFKVSNQIGYIFIKTNAI